MTMVDPREPPGTALHDRIAILERHVDHLLGQLYHQVELIEQHRKRCAHLELRLQEIEECPEQLDASLKRIANLREEIAGRKEMELELRRRLEELEREEKVKVRHIVRLERELQRIWSSPPHRVWRGTKRLIKSALGKRRDPDVD